VLQLRQLPKGLLQYGKPTHLVLCYAVQYAEHVPAGLPTAPNGSSRGGWEACRFYLLLASQLSIHREQLHQLILFHGENLDDRMDATRARRAERGA
jgi:hypothetical protein